MSTVSARKIRREAAKLNPLRKRRTIKVDKPSYFTKKHTEARKLHLPAYAAVKAKARDALAKLAA